MGMFLKYGTYSLYPVPDFQYRVDIQRNDAGYIIGTIDKITINGILHGTGTVNQQNTTLTNSSLNSLAIQYSGLKEAFSKDYQELWLGCYNGSNTYKSVGSRTIVDNISFESQEDIGWLQLLQYSIDISVYNTGLINYTKDSGYLVSNFTNTYSITTNDENSFYNGNTYNHVGLQYPSYSITREISAQGIQTSDTSSLDNAIKCVSGLAADSNIAFSNMLSNMYIYNRSTEISKDSINGSYSIRDTFIAYSGSSGWSDSYTITSTIDANLIRTVDIAGQVQGFASYPGDTTLYTGLIADTYTQAQSSAGYGTTKWLAASGGFFNHIKPSIFNRLIRSWMGNTGLYKAILPLSGRFPLNTTLNPIPISISIDHDIPQGSISYNYTYNSRPISMITGAISESIEMEDNFALRAYVFPDIFYRLPLAQDKGTYTNSTRSVTYTAIFPRPLSPNNINSNLKTRIDNVIRDFDPSGIALNLSNSPSPKYVSWITENNESFDVMAGRYTKRISWEYQKGYI